MKNNFTINSRIAFLGMLLFFSMNLFAQPANDNCANATALTLAADEASCVQIVGDTRMTVDATTVTGTPAVCSGSWYTDDVWFTFSTGTTLPDFGIIVKCEFGSMPDDVPSVGMAIYNSCGASEVALACFSTADPLQNSITIQSLCLMPDSDYVVRVWSGGAPNANAGTFRICAYENSNPNPSNATVFWGDQPSEGDFDGGLNDWTATSEAPCDTIDLWQWTPNGSTLEASVANMFGDATSSAITACNGAMVFNSDGFDQEGVCGAPQVGELISPVLDLSAIVPAGTAGVSVLFYQTTRQFQSTYIVSYTNDGGGTWNDIEINDEFIVNSATFNEYKRVFLPGADLTSTNFQFKFRYEANYYFWIIDDVQLIETEANNLQANTFFSIAPNLLTPKTQTDSVRFLIDVANVGATEQTGVNVNVSVTNSGNTEVFNENLAYGSIAANFVDENRIMPQHYLPPAIEDTYTAVYSVSADAADFDDSNNSQQFSFTVTDSVFAKEDGVTGLFGATPNGATGVDWTIATTYYVRNGEDPVDPNIKYECTSVLVGLDNLIDNIGGFASIYLYEWEDLNNDGISQNTERNGTAGGNIVGNFTYEIPADTDDATDLLISLENFNDPDLPLQLKENTTYVLAAGLSSAGNSLIEITGTNSFNTGYNATGFLTDSISFERIHGLGDITSGDGGLNTDLTGFNFSPRLRMHVNPYFEVSVNNQLDEANKVSLYPNPASEMISLQLDLVENMSEATIRIVDLNARNVMEMNYKNLSSQTINYNVSELPTGTYFLKIQSDKGYSTQKFTIVR